MPGIGVAMEQIFLEAGLPTDTYLNVFASNEQVADHDRGSSDRGVCDRERAGPVSAVAGIAGQRLKKVVLELGGSDAVHRARTDDVRGRSPRSAGRPDGERRPGVQRLQAHDRHG